MSTLARGSAAAAGMLAVAAAGIALTRPGRAALPGGGTAGGGRAGDGARRRAGKHRRPRAARWQGGRAAAAWLAAAGLVPARFAAGCSMTGRGSDRSGSARRVAVAGTGGAPAGQARTGGCNGVPGPAGHGAPVHAAAGSDPGHRAPVRGGIVPGPVPVTATAA